MELTALVDEPSVSAAAGIQLVEELIRKYFKDGDFSVYSASTGESIGLPHLLIIDTSNANDDVDDVFFKPSHQDKDTP